MPRRNRKGRRPGQRPRRFHSTREARRERRELVALDVSPPQVARECGNCLEWLPPRADAIGARGQCMHPASGVLAPDADTPACGFFSPRR